MSKLNVEQVKAESQGLRGPLPADLESADAFLSEAGKVLIKFHGSYEQTDRDKRGAAAKQYQFMVRSKLPGGRLTAAQYLAHDDIATRYGNGTLRITTRQGIQFHGVVKGHLRDTIREPQPRAGHDVRRLRRRGAQRDVLPGAERRPAATWRCSASPTS